MAVSKASLEIGKEISQLRTRLSVRVSNVEKRGLSSDSTNEARELLAESSVKGKTFRERQTLKRQLNQMLNRESTRVSGAISINRVQGKLNLNAGEIIQNTIKIKNKYEQRRVNRLLSNAYDTYDAFRDKHWRYQVRALANKAAVNHWSQDKFISRVIEIGRTIEKGDFDEADNKFNAYIGKSRK